MNTQKYLGSIKWFHDSVKNADYGFIVHETMGEVYFHKKGIVKADSSNLEAFSENQIVVFQLDDTTNNDKGKSALNVQLITSEDDLIFLFDELLKSIIGKKQTKLAGHFQATIFTRILKIKTERSHFFENKLEDLTPAVSQGIRKILSSSEILSKLDIKFLHKIFTEFLENDFNVFSDLIKSKLTDKDFFELWIDGITSLYNLDYISSVIFTLPNENQVEICKKLGTDGTTNLLHKILYKLSSWEEHQSIIEIKKVLTLSKDIRFEDHDKILNFILTKIPPYVKLDLWLDDYHDILDFHSYKLFTITLSANDQRKFVKKVANYVHDGKIELPFQELASIAVIDYEMSKNEGNHSLDYSTSIILHIMNELMINTDLSHRDVVKNQKIKIYEIVLKLLRDPKDILQITGYFDECKGRTYAILEDGETKLKHYENKKPRFHTICDGRKAIDLAKKDVLDEDVKLCFWWCANQKCFILHENYTMHQIG
ncbi:MAG: cold shock domain-containing protein [Saprospiraceae bacterium]|nr:cold shock domain-containing protein [Saprospiraceae bacterium]MBP6565700.1 cold shock domain-containing protein [Saprospiraceae bacterium]